MMLVKSEHYSDYIIRTFNVKRVSRANFVNPQADKYSILQRLIDDTNKRQIIDKPTDFTNNYYRTID